MEKRHLTALKHHHFDIIIPGAPKHHSIPKIEANKIIVGDMAVQGTV